jgi:hypothetical protein
VWTQQEGSDAIEGNKNKTYTFLPIQLSAQMTYKIKVTKAAEDVAGNGLASEFLTTTGFVTK